MSLSRKAWASFVLAFASRLLWSPPWSTPHAWPFLLPDSSVPGAALCLGRPSREKLRRQKAINLFSCKWMMEGNWEDLMLGTRV